MAFPTTAPPQEHSATTTKKTVDPTEVTESSLQPIFGGGIEAGWGMGVTPHPVMVRLNKEPPCGKTLSKIRSNVQEREIVRGITEFLVRRTVKKENMEDDFAVIEHLKIKEGSQEG